MIFVIFDVFPYIFTYFAKLTIVGRGQWTFVYNEQGTIFIDAIPSYLSMYGVYKAIVIGTGVDIDIYWWYIDDNCCTFNVNKIPWKRWENVGNFWGQFGMFHNCNYNI